MKKFNPKETIIVLVTASIVGYMATKKIYFVYIALTLGIIGIASTYLTNIINNVWMGLAKILSRISTTVLLFFVFFVILFPLAMLRKIFNRNSFFSFNNKTTFVEINKKYNESNFEKQW